MSLTLTSSLLLHSLLAFPPPPQMATCQCREKLTNAVLCEQSLVKSCENYDSYPLAAPDTVCEGYLLSDDEAPRKGWLHCFEEPVELGSQISSGAEGGVFSIEGRTQLVGKVLNNQADLEALSSTVFRLRTAYSKIGSAAPQYEGIGMTTNRRRVIMMEALEGGKRLISGQVDADAINVKTLDGIRDWYQRMYDVRAYDNDPQFVVEPNGTARPMDFGGLQCVAGVAELSNCPASIGEKVCNQYFNEWHTARRLAKPGSKVKEQEFDKDWYLNLRPGEAKGLCDFDSDEYKAP